MLGACLACPAPSAAQTPAPGPPPEPPAMTTAQLVGQHMIFSYAGAEPPAALIQRIRRGEAAGVILFTRNIRSRAHLRATMRRLQAVSRPAGLRAPLLIQIDQEGGLVKRLPGAPRRDPATLGRLNSVAAARNEGRLTAANLRDVGVNNNLAPVLDVARPGSFQERVRRSYGRDPARVSRLGTAFIKGLQERGVIATAKHFPGIGLPRGNEDDAASRIRSSQATIRRIDLPPFRAAITAGVKMIMTTIAIYPAWENAPAMFSRRLTTDELRTRMGFRGVTVTDDLETVAASAFGPIGRRARLAANAGNDLLLFAVSYSGGARAADALAADVQAGRVSRARLRESAARILALRASLVR